jgi:hypothetical protein
VTLPVTLPTVGLQARAMTFKGVKQMFPWFSKNTDQAKEWHLAYNYMVMALTHAAMTLKNGNCNEHVVSMYQDNCSQIILDWYGIATR